jgi:hypothetical protein
MSVRASNFCRRLDDAVHDAEPVGGRELLELVDRLLGGEAASGRDVDQDRAA